MKTKKRITNQWRNGCKNFLQLNKNREMLFALIGLLVNAAAIFYHFHPALFLSGTIAAAVIYFRLPYANVEIDSKPVRLGWAAIMLTIFYLPAVWLTFENEITMHVLGLFVSFVLCVLLYILIPSISYRLKLNDTEEGYRFGDFRATKRNGALGNVVMYGLIICIWAACESKMVSDVRFSREPYIPVLKWEKESYGGNTYYIVDCEKGRFSVSPYSYPQIRDINPNTRIKILAPYSSDGLLQVERLEIKNY